MAKQVFPEVVADDESWDAQLESWRDIVSAKAFPLFSAATIAALPTATQNDDGIMVAQDNDGTTYKGKIVVVSNSPDSGVWKKLAWQTATVAQLTDNTAGTANGTLQALTDPGDAPATADALRDDIVANLIPQLRNNYADLAAKVNELQTALKTSGAMAD